MAQVSIASFLASSDLIQAVEGHRAFPHLGFLTLGLLVHFRLLVDKMGVLDRFALKVQGLGRFRIEDLESLGSLRRQVLFLLFDQGGRSSTIYSRTSSCMLIRSANGTASAMVTSSKDEVAPVGCAICVASKEWASFRANPVELAGPAAPFTGLHGGLHPGRLAIHRDQGPHHTTSSIV